MDGPYIQITKDARIGCEWNNFSEYWSYCGSGLNSGPALPACIFSLINRSLENRRGETTIAFDVGANVGIFTAAFAAAGFSEIHTFEPVPATYARLSANVDLNHFRADVRLNQVGLGDREGRIPIFYDDKSPATAHIVHESSAESLFAQVTTLDRYTAENKIEHIDFLKVDTEGFETAVFQGASNLMHRKQISLILLEWCPELLVRAGSSPRELWDLINKFGYTLLDITSNGPSKEGPSCEALMSLSWANLVAIPSAVWN